MSTDFNFSDEAEDEGIEGEDDTTLHAGEEAGEEESEDRGDDVDGAQGDDDGNGEGGEGDGEGADPEFLAELAGEGGRTPKTVPYARLAEVTAQNQKLMEVLEAVASGRISASQVAQPQQTQEQEPAFDLKAKVKERNSALLEGDEDRAAEIDMEIEEYRNVTIRQQAKQEALADFEGAQQQRELNNIVSQAFGKYTFLNDQSDDYNEEALDEVMMYRNHYMSKGDSITSALSKAIDKVCPGYAGEDAGKPAGSESSASKMSGGRNPQKVLRNARAAAAQPPQTGKSGVANRETIDAGKLDLENMSDDDYDNLPEDVKARLRGDDAA